MALLPKSSSSKVDVAGWHPDFRVAERLPDLRVVRTGTFISILSVAFLCSGLLYVGQQEYLTYSLGVKVAALKSESEEDRRTLEKRIELSKRFDGLAARTSELAAFGAKDLLGTDVILLFSRLKPDDVRFSEIRISRNQVVLKVVAEDNDVQRLLLLSDRLVELMRSNPEIKALYPRVDPASFEQPKDGRIEFDIVLRR